MNRGVTLHKVIRAQHIITDEPHVVLFEAPVQSGPLNKLSVLDDESRFVKRSVDVWYCSSALIQYDMIWMNTVPLASDAFN